MKRGEYDTATQLLDKIEKIKRCKSKIKEAIPEGEYDSQYKAIMIPVFASLDEQKKSLQEIFDEL